MIIGGKEIKEIIVKEADGDGLLVSITDENMIIEKGVDAALIELP